MKAILITGGGSGIGQALAWESAKHGMQVFIVGRRLDQLQETAVHFPNQIMPIQADVSLEADRAKIVAALKNTEIDYIVHNAGVAEPFAVLPELDVNAWRKTIAINLEAPIFLTQSLLPHLKRKSRVLNISTGLTHRPLRGALAYCTSKAALYMATQCFNLELNHRGIFVGSVMPGVVDTEMQIKLRAQDKSKLPDVDMFRGFKEQGVLRSPTDVANLLFQFLEKAPNDTFAEKDWSIDELAVMFGQ